MADGPVARASTAALRSGDLEPLRVAFGRFAAATLDERSWDPRDWMLSLTPFIDCARRLGHDPELVFGSLAAAGSPEFVATFTRFVRRTDVTLGVMGWTIVDDPDGPAYRFAWPVFPPQSRRPVEGR